MSSNNKSYFDQTTGNNLDTPRFSITTLKNNYTVKLLRFMFDYFQYPVFFVPLFGEKFLESLTCLQLFEKFTTNHC